MSTTSKTAIVTTLELHPHELQWFDDESAPAGSPEPQEEAQAPETFFSRLAITSPVTGWIVVAAAAALAVGFWVLTSSLSYMQ